jgi:hypothetical protein
MRRMLGRKWRRIRWGGEGGGKVQTNRSIYFEMQEGGGRCWGRGEEGGEGGGEVNTNSSG